METLSHDTVFQLLTHLSKADLLNICTLNTTFASFCDAQNEYFWQTKVLQDYSNVPPKPDNISWKRFYILLGTTRQFIKQIPIVYDDSHIDHIWINNTDTLDQIRSNANQIFLKQYPNDDPDELRMSGGDLFIYWRKPISAPQLFGSNPNYYNLIQQLSYRPAGSIYDKVVPRGAMRFVTHRPHGR